MAKMMPKKLTPTSCTCRGMGVCKICKAKKMKAMAPKMGKPFGKSIGGK